MPVPLFFESREALEVMCTLGNSLLGGIPMDTAAELDGVLRPWPPYTGSRTHDAAEARAVAAIRPQLIELWDAGRDDAAEQVNAIMARWGMPPELVRHGDEDWHIHAVSPDRPLADRIAVESAMAFADLVRLDETDRASRCADPTCVHLFLDHSRNRSRRFCTTNCQARVNVAALRARRAETSKIDRTTGD